MKNPVKKVAAIHDLSGIGRVSLTSIIPILSSMGIQVCPFPTAVLSSNTSFFKEFTFVDLTDTMLDYMNHWKKIDIDFDCIYTGFLGSDRQVDIILEFIDSFKNKENIVVVDPVMGDNGKLYPTMSENMVIKMRQLVKKADIITPNFTESKFLLGEEPKDYVSVEEIKDILVKLSNMGPEIVVITSVPDDKDTGKVNVYAYEKRGNKFWNTNSDYIQAQFPGTGDSFASVLIGSLLNGDSLPIALDKSVQFIQIGIKESYGFRYPNSEGILLEKVLKTLHTPITTSNYKLI